MLVVIEGIDGCGKETQIRLLKEKTPDATVFKYPTKRFQLLNDYLERKAELSPKSVFLMFLADIANEQAQVADALARGGSMVILDRYVFSTISYELAEMHFPQAKKIVEGVGYLKPDHVLLLDIDEKTSQERKRKQKQLDRYEENSGYLAKVRANYLRLYEERFLTPNWHRIDATRAVEDVHSDIAKALRR